MRKEDKNEFKQINLLGSIRVKYIQEVDQFFVSKHLINREYKMSLVSSIEGLAAVLWFPECGSSPPLLEIHIVGGMK